MGAWEESIRNDISSINQRLLDISSGSGIHVDVTIGDMVGILNAAGVNINPSTEETLAQVRLSTARITQPSGQQLMTNSQGVVLASNHPIIPVSVTTSGQQLQANSLSVTLASNERIIPVSATVSGQQLAANSLSFTLASNERVIPVSATVSGQQLQANSLSFTLASNERVIPVSATVSGQQTMANSLSVALASNQPAIPVSVIQGSGIMTAGDQPFTAAMASGFLYANYRTVSDSNTRATMVTATAGKRLKVYEINAANYSNSAVFFEVYYGTGNDITVNPSGTLLNTTLSNTLVFPGKIWDFGSQESSASDVLSVRTSGLFATPADIASSGLVQVKYREI